jgi:glycosyltransferase involved in cell wall biosynthesis
VGRLVQEKGVQVAIQALAFMRQRAHLVVAGKGPMEGELRQLAEAWGLENRVLFTGRVSEAEKDAWLQHATAGLVPSLYEPFGIVALEVMAAGVPVVVGDTGGLAEIVTHGRDGMKVAPGDPGALAVVLDWLVANPDEAASLARTGRATAAERFAWPAIAAATSAVYRAAGGARRSAPFREVAAARLTPDR